MLFGVLSSICFMISGFPQMLMSIRNGNAQGVSFLFLLTWALGDIFLILYACISLGFAVPILVNAGFGLGCLIVIFRYYFWPRESVKA